jgi:hypothetical protein
VLCINLLFIYAKGNTHLKAIYLLVRHHLYRLTAVGRNCVNLLLCKHK